MAQIAVVIVNWNGAAFIGRCLDAVFAQTHRPDEVVVIDNGSTDESVASIRTRYPSVQLIARPNNEGFARGYNLGIRHTTSDYILILNTDVFLDRDFLYRARQAIEQEPTIGSIAARIYKADTDQIDYVGLWLQPWLKVVNSRNTTERAFVFAGSGAALFCRRDMLNDIREGDSFFDEDFFLYWEDVDLAWRAQLRGWRCAFAPEVMAYHLGSGSQGGKVRTLSKPAAVQRHIWKNRYLVIAKNASCVEGLVLLPCLLLGELLHWIGIAVRIPHRLPVFVGAHLDFLKLLPATLKKRRAIQRRRCLGTRKVLRFFRFEP